MNPGVGCRHGETPDSRLFAHLPGPRQGSRYPKQSRDVGDVGYAGGGCEPCASGRRQALAAHSYGPLHRPAGHASVHRLVSRKSRTHSLPRGDGDPVISLDQTDLAASVGREWIHHHVADSRAAISFEDS